MLLFEHEIEIPRLGCEDPLLVQLDRSVPETIGQDMGVVRLAVTGSSKDRIRIELGLMEQGAKRRSVAPALGFRRRSTEYQSQFNVALIIPTGIGAEVGGHAGDGGPVAALLAGTCDTLITHPNVVNASDINEIPSNALYVEGSVLSRLFCGTAAIQPVRSNRVLVVVDDHQDELFVDCAVNAVNAARATYGFSCPRVVRLSPPVKLKARYTSSGRAVGRVERLEVVCEVLEKYRGEYDAVAFSSVIDVPHAFHLDYFKGEGEMVNPWGGVEAIFTHAVSSIYNVPTAHSPMFESREIADLETGVVDPRMAAEAISMTFLPCVLKGLHRAPMVVPSSARSAVPGVFSAEDISVLVQPDGCIGIPTLAALDQGIPVVAVGEGAGSIRTTMDDLPWREGQLMRAANYWEAAGVLVALKTGVQPLSVRRPMGAVRVTSEQSDTTGSRSDILTSTVGRVSEPQ